MILALLRDLAPEQWDAQSLCTLWRVRDVAAHVVSYDELSKTATAVTVLRGGLRTAKVNEVTLTINEVTLDKYRELDPEGVIDLVTRHQRPHGLPTGFKGGSR